MSSPSSLRPVGEDMSSLSSPRCWGRHLGMLGKTLGDVGEDRNIGEDTQGYQGRTSRRMGMDIGEVRDDGEDIGDVGRHQGGRGRHRGGHRGGQGQWGRHQRMIGDDIGEDIGDDIGEVGEDWGRHWEGQGQHRGGQGQHWGGHRGGWGRHRG